MSHLGNHLIMIALSLCACRSVAEQFSGWYWVNTARPNEPHCVPLDEDPLSSLWRTFGSASIRVLQRSEDASGRLMVVEVQTPTESPRFAYATTLSACTRMRKALAEVDRRVTERQAQRRSNVAPPDALPEVRLSRPYTKEAIRRWGMGLTKKALVDTFGRPSSIGDLSGDSLELWYYDKEVLPVHDADSGTIASKTVFTISTRSGRVVRVGF